MFSFAFSLSTNQEFIDSLFLAVVKEHLVSKPFIPEPIVYHLTSKIARSKLYVVFFDIPITIYEA